MSEIRPILLATDFSPGAARATALAADAAKALSAPLVVVHAIDLRASLPPEVPSSIAPAADAFSARLKARDALASEALAREAERARALGAEADARLIDGHPWEAAIAEAARAGAELIVVGPHGEGGAVRASLPQAVEWILGSTADRVVRHAACPVLVAPHEGATASIAGSTWLVAIDFEHASRTALARAVGLARRAGSRIVAAHVARDAAQADQAGPKLRAMAKELAPGEDVALETRVVVGDPVEQLTQLARETSAALIVCGTHGGSRLVQAVLGSVADKLLRRATVPVLTMRA